MPSALKFKNGEPATASKSLTGREIAVLRHLILGERNKEIAGALLISERTVKFHVSSLMTKLGAKNRTEAVRIAILDGLIDIKT